MSNDIEFLECYINQLQAATRAHLQNVPVGQNVDSDDFKANMNSQMRNLKSVKEHTRLHKIDWLELGNTMLTDYNSKHKYNMQQMKNIEGMGKYTYQLCCYLSTRGNAIGRYSFVHGGRSNILFCKEYTNYMKQFERDEF